MRGYGPSSNRWEDIPSSYKHFRGRTFCLIKNTIDPAKTSYQEKTDFHPKKQEMSKVPLTSLKSLVSFEIVKSLITHWLQSPDVIGRQASFFTEMFFNEKKMISISLLKESWVNGKLYLFFIPMLSHLNVVVADPLSGRHCSVKCLKSQTETI